MVEVKDLTKRNSDVKSTLRQIFEGMLTQVFDALEAKGWETAIQYNITEEGEKYYIDVSGFYYIGVDSNKEH